MDINRLINDFLASDREQGRSDRRVLQDSLAAWADRAEGLTRLQLLNKLVLDYAQLERKLARMNLELLDKQQRLDQDLAAAAEIQHSLLPDRRMNLPGTSMAWRFMPCEMIGGDIFNLVPLDNRRLAAYMVDISGHGVPAALVAVSVSQLIHPRTGFITHAPGDDGSPMETVRPSKVLEKLDQEFPIERFDKTFSMVYLVLDTVTGELEYCNAGHPPPLIIRKDGRLEQLDRGGTLVGLSGLVPFENSRITLEPGERIILLTDGVTEHEDPGGLQFGQERLLELIGSARQNQLQEILDLIFQSLMDFGGGRPPRDDISLFGIQLRKT